MSFKSILDKIGQDAKGVFSWLGSPTGQAVVAAGEGVVETVFPPATAIIQIVNRWLSEVLKAETIATAAGQQNGTGTQKAAAVISVITPEVLAFLQKEGFPPATADQIAKANTYLVEFLNVLTVSGK